MDAETAARMLANDQQLREFLPDDMCPFCGGTEIAQH